MPQISLPRPRTTSPTARNSSAFSLYVSVGDSPVDPATTIASLPVSRRCDARSCAPSRSTAWSSSRNGVTIAVISDPNLPVMRPSFAAGATDPDGTYASSRCLASTPRPATTAPRASSTGVGSPRRTWRPTPTAPPTRRSPPSGSPGRSARTTRPAGRPPRSCSASCSWWAPTSPRTRRSGRSSRRTCPSSPTTWCAGSSNGSTTWWPSGRSPRSSSCPGANPASAALDLARSVVRRAERRVVELERAEREVNPEVRRYLNRLSRPALRAGPLAGRRGRAGQPRGIARHAAGTGAKSPQFESPNSRTTRPIDSFVT